MPSPKIVLVALCASTALSGCKTQYRSDITATCMAEATTFSQKAWATNRDGGFVDPTPLCKDCCHKKGFDDVEPGPCECGKLGLDSLMK